MLTSSFITKIASAAAVAVLAGTAMSWMLGPPAAAARAATGLAVAGRSVTSDSSKTTGSRPPGRQNESFAYDPRHHDIVMFGGQTASAVLGGTWVLSGRGPTGAIVGDLSMNELRLAALHITF